MKRIFPGNYMNVKPLMVKAEHFAILLASLACVILLGCSQKATLSKACKDTHASYQDIDYFEYNPSGETGENPSFSFFGFPESDGPSIRVAYWDKEEKKHYAEVLSLNFTPTIIGGPRGNNHRIYVGGFDSSGKATLVDFKLQLSKGVKVLEKKQLLGPDSGLSTITDFEIKSTPQGDLIYLLDGRLGEFGRLALGGEYESVVSEEFSKRICGYMSFGERSENGSPRSFWFSKEPISNHSGGDWGKYVGLLVNDNEPGSKLISVH